METLREIYKKKKVSLCITAEKSENNLDDSNLPLYIQQIPKMAYGILSVQNSTCYSYSQFSSTGNKLHSYSYCSENPSVATKSNSNEKTIALIVVICSLAFLCYFIYSWVSCYMKKPRVREFEHQPMEEEADREGGGHDSGEGYDMKPITGAQP